MICSTLISSRLGKENPCYTQIRLQEIRILEMSDKNIESIGNTFIRVYGAELKKQHDKTKKEFEGKREEYKLKREAQGINTIEQVAEWASEYSPPPTLKAWLLYKWEKFKVRTDKWSML